MRSRTARQWQRSDCQTCRFHVLPPQEGFLDAPRPFWAHHGRRQGQIQVRRLGARGHRTRPPRISCRSVKVLFRRQGLCSTQRQSGVRGSRVRGYVGAAVTFSRTSRVFRGARSGGALAEARARGRRQQARRASVAPLTIAAGRCGCRRWFVSRRLRTHSLLRRGKDGGQEPLDRVRHGTARARRVWIRVGLYVTLPVFWN